MKYTAQDLEEAGKSGALRAAQALGNITEASVEIKTTQVAFKSYEEFINSIEFSPVSFMIFSQTIKGPERAGVVLLALKEHEGRRFFKLLINQDASLAALEHELPAEGMSAISEVLNILSNSYINALSEKIKLSPLELYPPEPKNHKQLFDVLNELSKEEKIALSEVIVFETLLHINQEETHARLILLLDKKLLES